MRTWAKEMKWMSELGFNIPPTMKSYRDGTSVTSLTERSEKWGICPVIPWMVVKHVIHYITTTSVKENLSEAALKSL